MLQLFIMGLAFFGAAILDICVAMQIRRRKTQAARLFTGYSVFAAAVSITYFISIHTKNYTAGPILGIIVFCLTDLMVYHLLHFMLAYIYRKVEYRPRAQFILWVVFALVVADIISMLLNPFYGHVATYYYINRNLPPHFIFSANIGYYLHLVLIYAMLAYGFITMVVRTVRVPALYRAPYLKIIGCLTVSAFLTFMFAIFYVAERVDYTILTYSLLSLLIYYFGYLTGKHGALEKTGYTILNSSTQPVVVFDYMSDLYFANEAAQKLFPGITDTSDPITYDQFMDILNLDGLPRLKDDRRRFYWTPTGTGSGDISYICDYQEITDAQDNRIARSIIFTNNTLSVDPLTGYLTEQYFNAHANELADYDLKPVTVVVCDLNQLSLINNVLGYNKGDSAIELQAHTMRKHLPGRTIFVRLHDAKLGAICYGLSIEEIKTRLRFVNEELSTYKDFTIKLKMDFAIQELGEASALGETSALGEVGGTSALGDSGEKGEASESAAARATATPITRDTVDAAAARAISILKTRKLLDATSEHSGMIESLTQMLYEVDAGTDAHVRRTRILGEGLAFELGLSDYERDQLSLLCLFHDIGKVGIPLSILNKPGKLTDEEQVIMREHVQKGYRIARATTGLEIVAEAILHHHERWDGTGYPDGLQHEAIPILSRVIAVVDSYDAMVNDRPYHKAISMAEASKELKRCAGSQFDPYIVDAFVNMVMRSATASDGGRGGQTDDADVQADSTAAKASPNSQDSLEGSHGSVAHAVGREVEGLAPESAASDASGSAETAETAASSSRTTGAPEHNNTTRAQQDAETSHDLAASASLISPVFYTHYALGEGMHITEHDDAFEKITGYNSYDIERLNLTQNDLLFSDDCAHYWDIFKSCINKDGVSYLEHRIRCKDGSGRYVYCMGLTYPKQEGQEQRIEITLTDITEAAAVQHQVGLARNRAMMSMRRLENNIQLDPMTGLLNKAAFKQACERELMDVSQRCVLIMMDMDNFKNYNDTYGHPMGDKLLIAFSKILGAAIRNDELAGRMGGDEYCCLLRFRGATKDVDIAQNVAKFWDRLTAEFAQVEHAPSLSAGAACLPQGASDFAQMYDSADAKLYQAKRAGKNQIVNIED